MCMGDLLVVVPTGLPLVAFSKEHLYLGAAF